jgi:AcrR family transcriptional regulator
MPELSTSDHILAAAMELFSEKGFTAVTTREIAAKAQVSEVTLFRYFETKSALYRKVFEKYVVEPSIDDAFHKEPSGDLKMDLTNIALAFQNVFIKNLRLIKINMKDNHELLDFEHDGHFNDKFAVLLRDNLTAYFTSMKEKGKITGEPDILAINFMQINVGLILHLITGGLRLNHENNIYIESMMNIFVKGITA